MLADLIKEFEPKLREMANLEKTLITSKAKAQETKRQFLDLLIDNFLADEEFFRLYQVSHLADDRFFNIHYLGPKKPIPGFLPTVDGGIAIPVSTDSCRITNPYRENDKYQALHFSGMDISSLDKKLSAFGQFLLLRNKADGTIRIFYCDKLDKKRPTYAVWSALNEVSRDELCSDPWLFPKFYNGIENHTSHVINYYYGDLIGRARESNRETKSEIDKIKKNIERLKAMLFSREEDEPALDKKLGKTEEQAVSREPEQIFRVSSATSYESEEFGKLFSEYISSRFKTQGETARYLEIKLESQLGYRFGTYRAEIGPYCRGNLLGSQHHVTPRMKTNKVLNRLIYILYGLEVPNESKMIEIARQKFGTNFEYPPKPIQQA